jgi:hypothetical protein
MPCPAPRVLHNCLFLPSECPTSPVLLRRFSNASGPGPARPESTGCVHLSIHAQCQPSDSAEFSTSRGWRATSSVSHAIAGPARIGEVLHTRYAQSEPVRSWVE